MLITAFFVIYIWPESHRELRNEVGSLKPGRALGGIWTRNLPIQLHHLNPQSQQLPKMLTINNEVKNKDNSDVNWRNFIVLIDSFEHIEYVRPSFAIDDFEH